MIWLLYSASAATVFGVEESTSFTPNISPTGAGMCVMLKNL